jgi:hypothetical protein
VGPTYGCVGACKDQHYPKTHETKKLVVAEPCTEGIAWLGGIPGIHIPFEHSSVPQQSSDVLHSRPTFEHPAEGAASKCACCWMDTYVCIHLYRWAESGVGCL